MFVKKLKNTLFYPILFLILFIGFSSVGAISYTEYKAGDKITVNVNDSTKLDFYVIQDSVSENVTAIYDGVLGESFWFGPTTGSLTGSIAETKLNELTFNWDNPTEIRLIRVSEINSDFNPTIDLSEDITSPSYYDIGESYWTQDVAVNGELYYPILVTTFNVFSNVHSVVSSEGPASSAAIRPVITVSKEYVVDGTYISEDEKIWNNFVDKFKKTDLVETFEDGSLTITSTENSMRIESIDSDNVSTITNFSYNKGILTLIPSNNDLDAFGQILWVGNSLIALSDLKNYDFDKLDKWLECVNPNELKLEKDGIEVKTEKFQYTEDENGLTVNMSGDKILSFKLDIKNGLKSFNPNNNSQKPVENPKTGKNLGYGVLLIIILLSAVSYIIIRKKSKFKYN